MTETEQKKLALVANLTPQQKMLLHLICHGHTDKTATAILGCKEDTIGWHFKAIFIRLGVTTRSEAIHWFTAWDYTTRSCSCVDGGNKVQ